MCNLKNTILWLSGWLAFLLPLVTLAQTCPSAIPASTPTNQFVDNHNGSVTDKKTGLIWKQCSEGQTWHRITGDCKGRVQPYTWQNALKQAERVNKSSFAGKKDWRVPNIKELASIVEEQCLRPAINLTVFPNTPPKVFWSSSSFAGNGHWAWYVNFYYNGNLNYTEVTGVTGAKKIYYSKKNAGAVRLVRGG